MWVDTRAEEHHHPEKAWMDERGKAHYNFRVQLETAALNDLLDDAERLKQLRYDIEKLDRYKETFKHALLEHKVDLDKAVLKASEPHWDCSTSGATGQTRAQLDPDSEDDEKHAKDADPQPSRDAQVRLKRLARFDGFQKS